MFVIPSGSDGESKSEIMMSKTVTEHAVCTFLRLHVR